MSDATAIIEQLKSAQIELRDAQERLATLEAEVREKRDRCARLAARLAESYGGATAPPAQSAKHRRAKSDEPSYAERILGLIESRGHLTLDEAVREFGSSRFYLKRIFEQLGSEGRIVNRLGEWSLVPVNGGGPQ